MAAPVIFDGRAGRFRWPRRSFSMAAPVGFDGRAGRQLCPYEAQYVTLHLASRPSLLTKAGFAPKATRAISRRATRLFSWRVAGII